MIKPEDKALELIERMAAKFPPQSETKLNVWHGATLCALIAVQEIKAVAKEYGGKGGALFWHETEKELQQRIERGSLPIA